MRSPILAAAALLTLAACGGGGGSPPASEPPPPPSSAMPSSIVTNAVNKLPVRPDDPDTPTISAAGVKDALRAIYERSDTLTVEYGGTPLWTGQREVYEPSDMDDLMAFLFDGRHWGAPPNYDFLEDYGEFEFAGSGGGMSVAGAVWDSTHPDFRSAVVSVSLGVWMEHSFFLATEHIGLDPLHDDISVHLDIFSMGAASGTNPSPLGGSASWAGIMIGIDEDAYDGHSASQFVDDDAEPNIYVGEALVTIFSFEDPAVEVNFTNITNSVRQLDDVTWFDLPLTEGGFEGRGILGQFYGPQNEEVGGVFQFDSINGAFGAVRD